MTARILACAAVLIIAPVRQSESRLAIDGDFSDWAQIQPMARDGGDAPANPMDIGDVRAISDGRSLFMHLTMARPVALQGLPGTLHVVIDADGNPATGQMQHGLDGADVVVDCSPSPGGGFTVSRFPRVAGRPAAEAWTAVNFRYAPRHADTQVEWRLDLPETSNVRVRLAFAVAGKVVDDTPVLSIDVPRPVRPALTPGAGEADPLARPAASSVRVAVWNVAGMLPWSAEGLARIVDAIDPDILLLDEIWPGIDARSLSVRLPRASRASRLPWSIQVSEHGGQRNAVAVRGRSERLGSKVPYPAEALSGLFGNDAADRINVADSGVGASLVITHVGGRRILSVPVDLMCCGGPDSDNEARRIVEAGAINSAVRRARLGSIDAVLIGGDFNLVGTRAPLDIAGRGLDAGDTPLRVVDARKLDGLSKDTWRSNGGRFPPGRLDWLLHTSSTLEVVSAFVLDTADLGAVWLQKYKLRAGDSEVSDHLPIVADFRWK